MIRTDNTQKSVDDWQGRDPEMNLEDVLKFKNRMLQWPNPVEYVNNMYGCHPDNGRNEYFKSIFGK